MLRAKLFGRLAVEVNSSPVPPIAGLKPRSVLAYLLLNPGLHPRARLAARFWPDVLDTSARASLRSALWSVRSALEAAGGEAYLAGDRSSVGIAPDLPREVDVEQFDASLAIGDIASLSEAVALASGPLLSDLADEWVLDAQDDYRDRLVTAFERLADAADQAGETGRAIEWTKRALEQDRLREATYRQLIRRLAAAGEPAQALTVYRRCRAVLAAELGMAPTPETREVAERVRTGGSDEPDRAAPSPEPAARKTPRIVGREPQLDLLVQAWRHARDGHGGLALLSGEAGIGKSRLARELVAHATDDGALTTEGAPLELPGGPPFGPWIEAIQGLVAAAPAPPGDAPWPADLARLCPLVTARWGRSSGVALGAPDLERARLFEAVVELVAWCSRHRPVLVLLEDLHRADTASITLLSYVGRRLGEIAALVVATRRDAPPNGDLDAALDAFRSRGLMRTELVLGAMSPEQIAVIVAEVAPDLDPEIAARVAAAADGNPLLAREAARAAGSGSEPFDGIRAAVRTPVRRLSPPARLLVEIAATAGRPLDRREAAGAIGAEALHDAFLAGSEAGLLDGSDRQVRFVHELVRQACYAELPDARREWLHARLAELLARRGGGAAEVARHLRLAGDDDGARPQLVLAARQAQAFGALDEAAAFLREALEIGAPDRSEATATWFALAEVEGWRERREAMDEAFEHGLSLITVDPDPRALASAHAARGHLLRTGLCYPRESLAAYRRALETIDGGDADLPEVRVLALAGIAWGEAMVGDPTRVPPLIAQVIDQPEAGDDLVLAIELDMVRVAAAIRENRLEDVDGPGERAIALARRVGRADLISLTSTSLAAVAACRGQFGRVLELTENGLTGGVAGPTLEGYIHAARAYAFARLGRHDEAIAAAHEEVRLYERYGQPDFEALGAFDLGVILLATGDADASARQLALALETPTRHFSLPLARLRMAEALLASGDLPGAEVELARFPFEPVREADMPAVLVAHLARLQGLVAAAHGDDGVAERRLREAEAAWRRLTHGLPAGEMYATALVDLGRPPVAGLVEPGIELGRVLAELASVLTSAGRPDEAAPFAVEAATLADALAYDGYRRTLQSLPTVVADARV